jgi:hypothetical protein
MIPATATSPPVAKLCIGTLGNGSTASAVQIVMANPAITSRRPPVPIARNHAPIRVPMVESVPGPSASANTTAPAANHATEMVATRNAVTTCTTNTAANPISNRLGSDDHEDTIFEAIATVVS